jgi:hypothetical protein
MEKGTLRIPAILKHGSDARSEADLAKEARAHLAGQPGARFLADVLAALHASPHPLRSPAAFYAGFPPRLVLQALAERPELRVRVVRAITGGAGALLRRLPPAELATQIELLVSEDLPASERSVRAEEDRGLAVVDLYLKYLDPSDLAAYLPAETLWEYEGQDGWWKRDPTATTRALMTAELKSIRRHAALSDSEILDMIGDEVLERDLPLEVRTRLRAAARKAAREGRAFRDSDMFGSLRSEDGARDLTDHLVDNVSMVVLRQVIAKASEVLGLVRPAPEAAKPEVKSEAAKPEPMAKPDPMSKSGRVAITPKAVAEQPAQARPDSRAGRKHTPRAFEIAKPANNAEASEDVTVPSADEMLTGFDDDVIESDTVLVEEGARR